MGLWSVRSGLCQYSELHGEASEMWMKLMQEKEITWSVLLCDCVKEEFAHFCFIIVGVIQLWKII